MLIKKNIKEWEECLPIVEYAYNRARHSTTCKSPFEVVYGFNPLSPLDILPLSLQERANMDVSARASYLKKMHEETRSTIERQVHSLATKLNIHMSPMVFQPGDQVWIHLRKDRFPKERKSKLLPRSDGPFKVLPRYNTTPTRSTSHVTSTMLATSSTSSTLDESLPGGEMCGASLGYPHRHSITNASSERTNDKSTCKQHRERGRFFPLRTSFGFT